MSRRKITSETFDLLALIMNEPPDQYSAAWYAQQFKGFGHLLNRLASEYEDQYKVLVELRNEVAALKSQRNDDMAKLGQLSGRLDSAATVVASLTKLITELANKVNAKENAEP